MASRAPALSAAVGVRPALPPRALTTLSSIGLLHSAGRTNSISPIFAVNPPLARHSAASLAEAAMSSGISPCRGGAVRPLKMRGELTMAACSGCATGTLITSMRNRALLGFESGAAATQPGSSLGERTGADPDTYTYTLSWSFGSTTTVCVCEPRQVWTFAMYFGFAMSEMSKIRMPRNRAALTESCTPAVPQSSRPPIPSPDTNSRFLNTDTSLWDAGQRYPTFSVGRDGFEMSQT